MRNKKGQFVRGGPGTRTTHGMKGHRAYGIWRGMKSRCLSLSHKQYLDYGGRGIGVCEEWLCFEGFWRDMQKGYSDALTLDREDNDKGYCKSNCRWATVKEQQNNRRDSRMVRSPWGLLTLSEAADKAGLPYTTVSSRVCRGLDESQWLKPKKGKKAA